MVQVHQAVQLILVVQEVLEDQYCLEVLANHGYLQKYFADLSFWYSNIMLLKEVRKCVILEINFEHS